MNPVETARTRLNQIRNEAEKLDENSSQVQIRNSRTVVILN